MELPSFFFPNLGVLLYFAAMTDDTYDPFGPADAALEAALDEHIIKMIKHVSNLMSAEEDKLSNVYITKLFFAGLKFQELEHLNIPALTALLDSISQFKNCLLAFALSGGTCEETKARLNQWKF